MSEIPGAVTYNDQSLGVCGSHSFAHWKPGQGGDPVLCVLPHECGKTSGMELAFILDSDVMALTLEAPVAPDPRATPGPHPRINMHVNPGDQYGHSGCFLIDACVDCSSGLWPVLFAAGRGRVGRHLTDDEKAMLDECTPEQREQAVDVLFHGLDGNTISRAFVLVSADAAAEALNIAYERLRT